MGQLAPFIMTYLTWDYVSRQLSTDLLEGKKIIYIYILHSGLIFKSPQAFLCIAPKSSILDLRRINFGS